MQTNNQEYQIKLEKFLETINIKPADITLYIKATTHKSFSNQDDQPSDVNYENLEFLGDSTLGFVVSSYILKTNPKISQGLLTRYRAVIVETKMLSMISQKLGLPELLRTGPGKMHQDVINSPKVQADVLEALIGAIYLDHGLSDAIMFIKKFILVEVKDKNLINLTDLKDPKTKLQELFQSMSKENVTYQTQELGHQEFEAKAIHEKNVYGSGKGRSKKEAESQAAQVALEKLQKLKG